MFGQFIYPDNSLFPAPWDNKCVCVSLCVNVHTPVCVCLNLTALAECNNV